MPTSTTAPKSRRRLAIQHKVDLLLELMAFQVHPSVGLETPDQITRYRELCDLLTGQFPPWAPCVAARVSVEEHERRVEAYVAKKAAKQAEPNE